MTGDPAHRATPSSDEQGSPSFLRDGGEMGALMRAHDWSRSVLGPPGAWPSPLRTVVRLMLNTGHPMYIWWGDHLACLYNDAYRESIGPEQHPGSLGRPAREVWDEIWPLIGSQIEQVMSGQGATWNVNHLVPITRHGRREEVYWTYSYSPIDDETRPSGVGGVLVVCTETTQQVLAGRRTAHERDRLAHLFEQAPTFMAVLRGPEHRFEIGNPSYMQLVGHRPVLGRTVAEALPEAVAQGYVGLLDGVFSSGQAYAANGAKFAVQAIPGGPVVERFLDFIYQPIKNADGQVEGIFVQGVDVTDRTRAEAALRQSEASFRSALRAGRMGSWDTDFEAGTRQWSPEGMALFGLALEGGWGQVGGDDDEYLAALHPEDRDLGRHYRGVADHQDTFPAEYRIVRPDGTMRWLSGHGLVLDRAADGRARRLVSIMADTTERKQAEEALRVERERLSLALATGQMGTYDLDIRADALWWSPQMYALFGVRPEDFTPKRANVDTLVEPEDREAFLRVRAEAIRAGRPISYEFRVSRPDGTRVWLALRGQAAYDAQGVPTRSFGVVMDVTERKAHEDALLEADRSKDRFIATLAHELRNPLAPIRNAIERLRRTPGVEEKVTRLHDVIDRQVRQMARLLDDLLDVSRMSRNQLQIRRECLQLKTILEHAIEIAQPLIDAGEHAFTAAVPNDDLWVDGDLVRLAQVFSNLLINAAKYTPVGGQIGLAVACESDQVVVTVTDTGVGIAAQDMQRIFQMFGQLEAAAHRAQGGQGIGLSLAKGLVELHGGSIAVRSEGAGRGSQFDVRLPRVPAPATLPRDGAAGQTRQLGVQRRRILIADDLPEIADTLAILLQDEGHEAHAVYNGDEALRLAELLRPDVVVLDIGMPGMSGMEVCRRIRAAPWGHKALLIAQTGWGQQQDRLRTTEAGFDHHVVKPAALQLLLDLIASSPAWMNKS